MPLTLAELKSHLWDCAEILRGSAVDRTDWKAYILPLLFFKRICDVWDEETAEAAELFGDVDPVDFPEVHRFVVPEGCHWRDVRETPANVGAALLARHAGDRARQPRHALPRLRRRRLGQPGDAHRRAAEGSDRGVLARSRSATRRSAPTSSATPTST